MSLTLITGPANAGKAARVLSEARREALRGSGPWLVVPTAADEREYRRELAQGGVAVGVRVARFPALMSEVLRRAGTAEQPIEGSMRTRLLAVLAQECDGSVSAGGREGRARELARLV
ncbi:MAG: hypothetical protein ACYDA6_04310, partial [Solirubrobacteraceae bacterium]